MTMTMTMAMVKMMRMMKMMTSHWLDSHAATAPQTAAAIAAAIAAVTAVDSTARCDWGIAQRVSQAMKRSDEWDDFHHRAVVMAAWAKHQMAMMRYFPVAVVVVVAAVDAADVADVADDAWRASQ
jgi:hypothetical protein